MTNEPIAVLEAVRDLISNPERWTKEFLAAGAKGNGTSPYERTAVCWCLLGALARVSSGADDYPALIALSESVVKEKYALARDENPRACITRFNDDPSTTHAAVLQLIDDTLTRLRNGK